MKLINYVFSFLKGFICVSMGVFIAFLCFLICLVAEIMDVFVDYARGDRK